MKLKKRFNLIEEYKKSFLYIKETRKYIYGVLILFFVFALIGFFVPAPEIVSNQILEYIEKLLDMTKDFGFKEMFGFIFFNNLKSSFIGLVLGIFFGVLPVYGAISNGYVLGFVSIMVTSEQGASILWRLAPHGIPELSAIFISLGMGVKLGSCFFKKKDRVSYFKDQFKKALKVFILIVLPLLLIAAILESVFMFFV